ncbi:MAG TPA: terminase gpA endonuclease subunit, partial [Xanthobacteraceae bacterium]|nr:terminase gpA endonuclease subunit [Xanthobacteraceae bacterium]
HALRVSDELPANWFDQVTGEVRRVRYVRNRPVIEFTPKRRGQQVEALDALCYAWAVRQSPAVKAIDLRARAARRPTEPPPSPGAPVKPPPRRSSTANWARRFNES